MTGKIYMSVPYAEKDTAKAMGAKWDAKLKKWYYHGPIEDYIKFAKWIADGREHTIIAYEHVYVVEGMRQCYKCRKHTRVIGLGIGEHIGLVQHEDDSFEMEIMEDYEEYEPLHLAWVDSEDDIPPALLRYLMANYNVKTGYSGIAGKCFANHCDNCGVIQGNWHLFNEDSPLTAFIHDGPELGQRLSQLKIYSVGIDENLVLDWEFGYGSNDELYFKYNKPEELALTPSHQEDGYISYEEMYHL